MKKLAVLLTSLLLSTAAFADEAYQMSNVVGHWRTSEYPLNYNAMNITANSDGKGVNLEYCNPIDIVNSGSCVRTEDFTGMGLYNPATDKFQISETNPSPTPIYSLKVDDCNPDVLLRSFNNSTVEYYRVR